MNTTTPPPETPPKSPPPAPRKPTAPKKRSPPTTPTQGSEFIGPDLVDRFTTPKSPPPGRPSSQNTPANKKKKKKKKKKRVGWQGKTKGYNYKVSKQGTSKGTGPAKASPAAPRGQYTHVKLPDLSARELAAARSTRSKGAQVFHALVI